MTTNDFIDLLEEQRLAPSNVTRQLRAKAEQGDQRITPKSILKYLVKKEIVSRAQAKELLETVLVVSDKAESSILGFSPLVGTAAGSSRAPELPPEQEEEPSGPPSGVDQRDMTSVLDESSSEDDPVMLEPIRSFAPALDEPAGDLFSASSPAAPQGLVEAEASKLQDRPKKSSKYQEKRRKQRESKKSEWDSPLLLIGGTALAVLVLAGLVIYWLLGRENADLLLKEANDAFANGSYTQAIPKYEKFVTDYPSHQNFSHAKVRLGMAELWRDAERTTNFAGALATAQRVIKQIEDELAFASDDSDAGEGLSQAKKELSSLLTTIAKGLAQQAEESDDPAIVKERIEQINATLALTANTKYVPQRVRLNSELDAVREALTRIEMRQQRETDLAAGLAEMDQAIESGEISAAFQVRTELLAKYPALFDSKPLHDKVLAIAEAERQLVKFVAAKVSATTTPAPSSVVAELALADRQGKAAGGQGITIVVVDGAVFALNVDDGSLAWRRFVGLGGSARPVQLPDGNVVVPNSQQHELCCLEETSGKLVWRLPLEGALATPVVADDKLFVSSDAGRLYVVRPSTGEQLGYVQFKQPLRVQPVASETAERIYVLGEHSNIYTLSGADFACLGVHYVGHAPGGAAVPPVLALNKVIVADNTGAATSRIVALSVSDQGVIDNEVASHRLAGLVTTPLQTAARRVAAVTTLGQAVVFEVSAANDKAGLTVLASRDPQKEEPLAQFALLHEGHLWVAGRQLTKLAVLPTGNQLPVRSIDRDFRGDAFDYPLQTAGDLLVLLRRPANSAGAIIAATDAEGGVAWETQLAVPPAGAPAVDASGLRITAGASSGVVFLLDRAAMTRRVQNEAEHLAAAAPAKLPIFTDALDLSQGRLALASLGGKSLLHFRPDNPRESLRAVELAGPLSCPLVAWRDGFVAATNVGQVALLNADDALLVVTPFQPELTPGQEHHWLRPAVASSATDAPLVVSDGVRHLYLINVSANPQPHLEAVATAPIDGAPLVTPLAVAGDRVFAGNDQGQLASFMLPGLEHNEPLALDGRVTWGPHTAGGIVIMGLDSNELVAVGSDGTVRWRQPLKHGELGGAPLIDGDNAFLLFSAGGIARVSLRDGAEAAFNELGQPAIAGPVAFGPRLVVAAPDGTLLVVNRP